MECLINSNTFQEVCLRATGIFKRSELEYSIKCPKRDIYRDLDMKS